MRSSPQLLAVERRPHRQRFHQFPDLVPAHVDGGEVARGRTRSHLADLVGDRKGAAEEDGARRIHDLVVGGIRRGDGGAAGDLGRRRGEGVVGRVDQRVAGGEVGGGRCGQHGHHDGDSGRQDQPGAKGHVSRRM